ncbi:hypothetical protein MPSEU_000918000 [Mayamaea pseudoterrestris]|nr:hypothetical protein MPSEU_000918000 [Mayamaea pseudoterrestris]
MLSRPPFHFPITTMGRFHVVADSEGYEGDHDEQSPQEYNNSHPHWEFTAEKGEEGAIVVHRKWRRTSFESDTSNGNDDDDDHADTTEDECYSEAEYANGINTRQDLDSNGRRMYFWEQSDVDKNDDNENYDESHDFIIGHRNVARRHQTSCFAIMPYIVLLIAFLSWWIREGPPAPPFIKDATQQHTNWKSFLGVHSRQWLESSSALFFSTPAHVLKWWAIHVKQDVMDIVKHFRSGSRLQLCELALPKVPPQNLLVGQDRATAVVWDALLAWKHHFKKSKSSLSPVPPLLLYFSGFRGTGRTTLAQRLHQLIYLREDESKECRMPAFLHLRGKDYATAATKQQLAQKLRNTESIVVIDSVEDMDKSLFTWVVSQLTTDDSVSEAIDEDASKDNSLVSIRHQLSGCIVIFTSTIGSRSIARNIKLSAESSSLLLDIGHELDTHFGDSRISERLDAVVPFLPLTQESLRRILQDQVKSFSQEHFDTWKSFWLTDVSLDYFVGPDYVEYLSWQVQSRPILTFASAGATVLSKKSLVWNRIHGLVGRCQLESNTDQVAIMNILSEDWQVTISWCPDEQLIDSCQEACRLPL